MWKTKIRLPGINQFPPIYFLKRFTLSNAELFIIIILSASIAFLEAPNAIAQAKEKINRE